MRKLYCLAFLLVAGLALCGCAKESTSSALPGAYRSDKAKLYENIPETFDGRYLDTVDIDIEIEEVRVLPAGAKGNEEGERPVLAFWYDATNQSEEELSAFDAWIRCFVPTQHQDQLDDNYENDLAIAKVPDSRYKKTQNKKLKQNESAKSAIAFEIADMKAPVTLFAKTAQGKLLGSQDYNPADLLKDRLLKKTTASDKSSTESAAAGTKAKQKGKMPSKRVENAVADALTAIMTGAAITKGNLVYYLSVSGYTDAEINEAISYIDIDSLRYSPYSDGRDPFNDLAAPPQGKPGPDLNYYPEEESSSEAQQPSQQGPAPVNDSYIANEGSNSMPSGGPVDDYDYSADWPDWSATDPVPAY
ncbi:DUF5067 domain-containing protein [Aerococcus sp. UMB7834]|uniref:DUF5067 domain-containing protein n=1 Tax=Aerococcus sp. UMB7834 TaxID=3046342 RepID=UPI00254CA99E|nr:DUF5067 domain-containing protein [Aerococcus sp. UMB7834]MDK6805116.1 DUF5067 domain-containing protein [Aerococcus sp. UMB7834]